MRDTFVVSQDYFEVMMRRTRRSVSFMASRPMEVRLWMVASTSSLMIPSVEVTHLPFIASMADIMAVETPEEIFNAQDGFAPSQIMPVRFATIFLTAAHTSLNPPPIR